MAHSRSYSLSFTSLRNRLLSSLEQLDTELDNKEEITPDFAKAIMDVVEVGGLVGIQIAQELNEIKHELRKSNAFRETD